MLEQFSDLAVDNLDSSISDSDLTLTLVSAIKFPATGQFRIVIDSEYITVTAVASNVFTILRGQSGSVAAAHTAGAVVSGILEADSFDAWRKGNQEQTTLASALPGQDGRVIFAPDSSMFARDDGSNLNWRGSLHYMKPVVDSDFAWVNQGGATINNGFITAPADAGSANLRVRTKAAPVAESYKLTAYIIPLWLGLNYQRGGIGFRESATGKIAIIYWGHNNQDTVETGYYGSPTSFDVYFTSEATHRFGSEMRWLRLINNGTTLYFQYGVDGFNFTTLSSYGKSTYFTSGPDQLCFFVASWNTSLPASINVLSWIEE